MIGENKMNNKGYEIYVRGSGIGVSKEVYYAYYQELEHENYLLKTSKRHTIGFSELEKTGYMVNEMLPDDMISIEQLIEKIETKNKLLECLGLLSPDEQQLIQNLFYDEMTLREIAEKLNVSWTAVHKRKVKILEKLKNMIEI